MTFLFKILYSLNRFFYPICILFKELILRRPTLGDLKRANITEGSVTESIKLLKELIEPNLSDAVLDSIDGADFLEMQGVIAGFLQKHQSPVVN
jgi:hypothetical protein